MNSENRLEELLRLAADEPAHRPAFYKALLTSDVFVLGRTARCNEGKLTLKSGSQIELQHWEKPDGTSIIGFFSSLTALQSGVGHEVPYLRLSARDLFEITLGTSLYLNPKAPYGKEFTPEEVNYLLKEGVDRKPIQRVVEKDTQVLLGKPAQSPTRMINSLRQLLTKHPGVKRAFVSMMHDESINDKPHLLVGVEVYGNIERVMREAGAVAVDTAPAGEVVDLVRITEDDVGVSQYFLREVTPFYERTWSSKIRFFFGKGKA